MKKLIFLLMMPTLGQAQSEIDLAKCHLLGENAYLTMEIRQSGYSQTEFLGDMPYEQGKALIRMAYKYPRHHTEASKVRAAEDFRDLVEGACLDNLE